MNQYSTIFPGCCTLGTAGRTNPGCYLPGHCALCTSQTCTNKYGLMKVLRVLFPANKDWHQMSILFSIWVNEFQNSLFTSVYLSVKCGLPFSCLNLKNNVYFCEKQMKTKPNLLFHVTCIAPSASIFCILSPYNSNTPCALSLCILPILHTHYTVVYLLDPT